MLSKALILVLLGATLTLANPVNVGLTDDDVVQRAWKDNVVNWLNGQKESAQDYFEQTNEKLEKLGENLNKVAKEKFEQLKNEFNEIREDAKNDIEKEKKKWDTILEKAIQSTKDNRREYEELKQKAKQTIESKKKKWEDILQAWKVAKMAMDVEKACQMESQNSDTKEECKSYDVKNEN